MRHRGTAEGTLLSPSATDWADFAPPGTSLRLFSDPDAAECARIFAQAWRAGHPYAPRQLGLSEFRGETVGEVVIVAVSSAEQILGFAGLYLSCSFVHHLYVDPDFHGCGVGRALLAATVAIAGGRATLKCQQKNPGALAFYRRLGWSDGETGDSPIGPWVMMHSPQAGMVS